MTVGIVIPMYLCYLHAEALGEAEHDDVDAIGIADEVVVEHEVVLVPGELPDADLTHAAQTDALHADAQGVRGEAPGPRLLAAQAHFAWKHQQVELWKLFKDL